MAMTPEGRLYQQVRRAIERRKSCYNRKIRCIKISGCRFQETGLPDVIIVAEGRVGWFELKRNDGKGVVSKRQALVKQQLLEAGAEVFTVMTIEEVEKWLDG
jgi:hypothetical protein